MEFFATCSRGFEAILGAELRAAGVQQVRPLRGGVSFQGEVTCAYRALLWSRVASRVLLTLARVPARNANELYEAVKALPWEDHLSARGTLAVDARGVNNQLQNTHFTALKVKDAIVDRLQGLHGMRPSVNTTQPDVRVNLLLNRERATVSIDLTGAALEHRGYRAPQPQGAPLRENLAAALLLLAAWPQCLEAQEGLVNPFCGTGALAIEAALMAAGVAPGITRSQWGFNRWLGHDDDAWSALLEEADARAEAADLSEPCVVASDPSPKALAYARACARRAGVEPLIVFEPQAERLVTLRAGLDGRELGLVAANLAGETQFSSLAQLPPLYAELSALARSGAATKLALLSSDPAVDGSLGLEAQERVEVRNGAVEAAACVYDVQAAAAPRATVTVRDRQVNVNDANVEQFAARLAKMARQRRKWAKKEEVRAYRVYDADLPDYNLAVDVYHGAGPDAGRVMVHVAEYAAPKHIDPAKAARRLSDALAVIPLVLDVPSECVFVKRRLRAKGGSQYAQGNRLEGREQDNRFITQESGLLFEVNLGDRLDTGLFLDHRETRRLLRRLAPGKSFLNLFAYTGAASVYAAAGGARFTTTVDLSNTYQEWSRRNLALNGFTGRDYQFERADVLAWVQEKRHSRERWDLVFVDPPTFSNSAKMGRRTWDVQADHAELLIGVSRLLTRQGAIVFSCNLRDFKPDVEKLARAGVVINDITARTIPEDFARNAKVHHCYVLRRSS